MRNIFNKPIEIKISRDDLITLVESTLNRDLFYADHRVMGIEMHPMAEKVMTITLGPELKEEDPEPEPEITRENLE